MYPIGIQTVAVPFTANACASHDDSPYSSVTDSAHVWGFNRRLVLLFLLTQDSFVFASHMRYE